MKYRLLFLGVVISAAALAQTKAIENYLKSASPESASVAASSSRGKADIQSLLPHRVPGPFVRYVEEKASLSGFSELLGSLDSLRLNKLVGGGAGPSGTTALVSRVATPAVLGFGVEYGGILQENNATVSTLRGNLLGIGKMAFGGEQFAYCPEIDPKQCGSAARWLRRFSAAVSFENVRNRTTSVAADPVDGAPVLADLFGNGFRMASWGARFDWTGSNNLDDPKYVSEWRGKIEGLRKNPSALAVSEAVSNLFAKAIQEEVYNDWMAETVTILQRAPSAEEFARLLEQRLDFLIERLSETDSDFMKNVGALRRAYSNYFQVRDGMLRELQSHKLSLEYTNQHPQNQFSMSNLRLIYSHQPTASPTLITVNAGFTLYHSVPAGAKADRLRDVQLAGQLDRRLGEIPGFGHAVATFAGYYQWMREDALIRIGPGNVAPGSGIVLPGTAAALLGTKGHIGVVQGKLSIPISELIKIPISVTWANRTELIKEKDVRGQIGLTMDIDSLFH